MWQKSMITGCARRTRMRMRAINDIINCKFFKDKVFPKAVLYTTQSPNTQQQITACLYTDPDNNSSDEACSKEFQLLSLSLPCRLVRLNLAHATC